MEEWHKMAQISVEDCVMGAAEVKQIWNGLALEDFQDATTLRTLKRLKQIIQPQQTVMFIR